jgi:hypothetical protein
MNSESLRIINSIFIYLLVISYITTLSSCTTTESLTVSPDSLNSSYSDEIVNIKLKNGNSVNCENKIVEIIKRTDSTVALYISSRVSRDNTESFRSNQIIPLNDILSVQLDKIEADFPMTILIVGGALIVLVGLTLLAAFSFSF